MRRCVRFASPAALLFFVLLNAGNSADWPSFRGLQFGESPEKDLPSKLSEKNILWKAKLPGPGASSPVVSSGKVFVTCYTGYGMKMNSGFGKNGPPPPPPLDDKGFPPFGKEFVLDAPDVGGDQKDLRLQVLCLDAKTGRILWREEIAPKLPEAKFARMIRDHGYASSTPATDGEQLYVFFGKTGVICFDIEGKKVWQESVGTETDEWGSASSPILFKDLVIVNAAIESRSLVALEKKTGKQVWRVQGTGRTWSSPILVKGKQGKDELVVSLPGKLAGYDPASGQDLWHCQGIDNTGSQGKLPKAIEPYTVSTPVARDGIIYLVGGGGPLNAIAMAVEVGSPGDVNKPRVLWRKNVRELLGSPVVVGNSLCWVSGVLTALDVNDGRTLTKERLCSNSMDYTSPVVAGGTIYALTRFDGLFVVSSRDKFQTLARLEFPERDGVFNGSPAASNGRLYVRSNAYLYCIGNVKPE